MIRAFRAARCLLSDRIGGSALEFALVAMPFVLVLLGTLEFARLVFYQNALANATTAAARILLLDTTATPETLKQYIADRILNADPDRLTVTFSDASDSGVTYRTIATTYAFDFVASTLFDFEVTVGNDTKVPIF